MMLLRLVCFVIILVSAQSLTPDQIRRIEADPSWKPFMKEYDLQLGAVPRSAYGVRDFKCPTTTDIPAPKNIHTLAPKFISVVAALGDSLTAANGADAYALPGVAREYRGVSFSIGGDGALETTLTLPNIIRKYNAAVFGPSNGIGRVNNEKISQLNVGVPGARARNLSGQADMLIQRLGQRSQYKDDWKLVTIFIGANDVCACKDLSNPDPAVKLWISQITDALDKLAAGLTNTFVNLVNVIMVGRLRAYEYYYSCAALHKIECSCVMENNKQHDQADALVRKYQQALQDVPKRYEGRSDFTVVLQPYSTEVVIPTLPAWLNKTKPDLSYLAPDCFHFSQRGHAAAAAGLWNNMVQPFGKKQQFIDPKATDLICPDTNCPYLRTSVNSVDCSK